jgi:hypothetical protein
MVRVIWINQPPPHTVAGSMSVGLIPVKILNARSEEWRTLRKKQNDHQRQWEADTQRPADDRQEQT